VADRFWILEVEIFGRPYRWSTVERVITTAGGEEIDIDGGLVDEPDASPDDEVVDLLWLDPSLDLTLISEHLEAAPATLYRWTEGQPWERRQAYVVGLLREVEHGTPREPIDATLRSTTRLDLPICDAQARVDASTWPVAAFHQLPDSQVGLYYPRVFGVPGHRPGQSPQAVMPVPVAEYKATAPQQGLLVVADRVIPATQVWTYNEELGTEGYQLTSIATDDLGRPVMGADFSNTPGVRPTSLTESMPIWAGFSVSFGGGTERNAYDVIVALLQERARSPVDWDRLAQVEGVLSGYLVDTWITDPDERPWDWLPLLLQDLPVEVRWSTVGRYLERQRWWATADEAIARLSVDRGDLERRGRLKFSEDEIANELVVRYGQLRTDGWQGQVVISGQAERLPDHPELSADARIEANPLCAISQSRYQDIFQETINVGWTWDEGTARKVALERIERRALPRREGVYWVADGDQDGLQAADVILVDDDEMGMEAQVAIVAGEPVPDASGGAVVTLRLPPAL
jgi:hypothetical protein